MRRLLAGVRDGGEINDTFYLGTLEEKSNDRFAAQLATLSTIQVPAQPAARATWIAERRVWRLHEEFARDLHTRLLNTFTRLGFDEHGWFSDADLEVLINKGDAEVAVLKTALADARRAIQEKEAANQKVPDGLRKSADTKAEQLRQVEELLLPYQQERERRRAALTGQVSSLQGGWDSRIGVLGGPPGGPGIKAAPGQHGQGSVVLLAGGLALGAGLQLPTCQ